MSKYPKILLTLIFTVILLLGETLYCIDTNAVAYFPLNVGNIYVYNVRITSNMNPPRDTVYKARIIRDTLIAGRKYFMLSGYPKYETGRWYRVDTLTGSLYRYNPSNSCPYYISESFVDSLAAEQGDTIGNCGIINLEHHDCISLDTLLLFNFSTYKKIFHYHWGYSSYGTEYYTRFARNIGMYYYYYYSRGVYTSGDETCHLKGCIVNGILYGDTSVPLGIRQISGSVPIQYSLLQNYPNPFNPLTKILFNLTKTSFTNITIYDLLGRQIEVLVNSELRPGTYEINWNAEQFSSGIYVYRMEAEEPSGNKFVDTKKMILIK